MVVLVIGGYGQLGQSLQLISKNHPQLQFFFTDSNEIDITDKTQIETAFSKYKPVYCINASAYTAVDKAETEVALATAINVTGVKYLAEVCLQYQTVLFHISTDFVFDGQKRTPYNEKDIPNPKGVYGYTKLGGEKEIQSLLTNYFIIRTSWLYSQFANNFMKTMLRLASERNTLSVVNDQVGTPTHAVDLAQVIVTIIERIQIQDPSNLFGIYHYSNEGQCSWYDFAHEIFNKNKVDIDLIPIPTTEFPTPAQRPAYSVLDKTKIKNAFGIHIKKWEESLQPFPN
jgi:dTDP-4-dehydrorhamnose reductase